MFAKRLKVHRLSFFCLILSTASLTVHARTELATRIVGGEDATIQDYPHQVALLDNPHKPFESFFCGGSIIAPRWILTAAHCVPDSLTQPIYIASGISKLTEKATLGSVKRIIVHEGYSEDSAANDLALLELHTALTFNAKVNAISLAEPHSPVQVGHEVAVSGWGSTHASAKADDAREDTLSVSEQLQVAHVFIVPPRQAKTVYGESFNGESMLAAGVSGGGRDSCQGDSGGPLTLQDPVQRPVLVGIVSWGEGCARPDYPGVYTKVGYFKAWIEQQLSNNPPSRHAGRLLPSQAMTE